MSTRSAPGTQKMSNGSAPVTQKLKKLQVLFEFLNSRSAPGTHFLSSWSTPGTQKIEYLECSRNSKNWDLGALREPSGGSLCQTFLWLVLRKSPVSLFWSDRSTLGTQKRCLARPFCDCLWLNSGRYSRVSRFVWPFNFNYTLFFKRSWSQRICSGSGLKGGGGCSPLSPPPLAAPDSQYNSIKP